MIRETLREAVITAVRGQYGIDFEVKLAITDSRFGDFSTNAAFQLAPRLKHSPQVIAAELAAKIRHPAIAEVAVRAGFINFKLDTKFMASSLSRLEPGFYLTNIGRGGKVQVEFVSANPTGPLTLANARGGYFGDVLANVLEASGYSVIREYYVNDMGLQIQKLVEAIRVAGGEPAKSTLQYQGGYIKDLALNTYIKGISDSELAKKAVAAMLEGYIMPPLGAMGVKFDVISYESQAADQKQLKTTIDRLRKARLIKVDQGGTLWLLSGKLGDERQQRVLIRANGESSYLLKDMAYHLSIFEARGIKRAIKIWGADHAGQVNSLVKPLKAISPKAELEFVILQMVRLVKNGKEFKISKREGKIVTIDSLLKEVNADVVRFFFLMRSSDSRIDFDLNLAKEESQKNPLHYIEYAYVRALSILDQAKQKGLKPAAKITELDEHERALVLKIFELPTVVQEIAKNYQVHRLTFYGQEMARLFHDYYEKVRIIDLPQAQAGQKLLFLEKITLAFTAYFQVLGIKPRKKM